MKSQNELFFTGSTGISGSSSVSELVRRNYHLRIMVRNLPSNNTNDLIRYVSGDLSQIENLQQITKSNAGIVHYACASLRGRADPKVDVEAMKVLLENWKEGPFVFISTLDVYGAPSDTKYR